MEKHSKINKRMNGNVGQSGRVRLPACDSRLAIHLQESRHNFNSQAGTSALGHVIASGVFGTRQLRRLIMP
jgi:hypothetical protein